MFQLQTLTFYKKYMLVVKMGKACNKHKFKERQMAERVRAHTEGRAPS